MKTDEEIKLESDTIVIAAGIAVKNLSKKIIMNIIIRWLLMTVYITAIITSIILSYYISYNGISLIDCIIVSGLISLLFTIAHLLNIQLYYMYKHFEVFDILLEYERSLIEEINESGIVSNVSEKINDFITDSD